MLLIWQHSASSWYALPPPKPALRKATLSHGGIARQRTPLILIGAMMSLSDERGILERESVANLAMSISQILTASEPLEQILQQCVESLIWHLDLAFARIWLLDSTERTLVLAASAGLSTNLHGTFSRIPVATSLKIGRVVRERRPHLTNRLHEETWVRDQEWVP